LGGRVADGAITGGRVAGGDILGGEVGGGDITGGIISAMNLLGDPASAASGRKSFASCWVEAGFGVDGEDIAAGSYINKQGTGLRQNAAGDTTQHTH